VSTAVRPVRDVAHGGPPGAHRARRADRSERFDQARYAVQWSFIRCTWPEVNWYMQASYV
jgi:hypothetical protein